MTSLEVSLLRYGGLSVGGGGCQREGRAGGPSLLVFQNFPGGAEGDHAPRAWSVLIMQDPGSEATGQLALGCLTVKRGEPQGRGRQGASYPARQAPEGFSGRALANQWQMMKNAGR